MNHATYWKPVRVCAVFLILIFVIGFGFVQTVHAADTEDGWRQNIELTGNFVGTFTLDSNTAQILQVNNAAPGDVWGGEIAIRNSANGPMEVSLLKLVSTLEDNDLFNTLELEIKVGDDLVYAGSYGATPQPVTPFYVIPADQTMIMDVSVSFPPEAGNDLQGKEMDSIWTFEARYLSDGPGPALYPYTVMYIDDVTGDRLVNDKVSYAPYGDEVAETALDIAGFVPDAAEKSIVIHAEDNVIVFLYEQAEEDDKASNTPEAPSDSNSQGSSGKGVDTGTDLADSNTTNLIYALLIGALLLSILIIILRIRSTLRDD